MGLSSRANGLTRHEKRLVEYARKKIEERGGHRHVRGG